jgi:hypothetical protein
MATFGACSRIDDWTNVHQNTTVMDAGDKRSRSRACTTCHMVKRKSDFPSSTSPVHFATMCRGCILLVEEEGSMTLSEEIMEEGEVVIDGSLLSPGLKQEGSMPLPESPTPHQLTSPSLARRKYRSLRTLRPRGHVESAQPVFNLASDGAELV